MKSCNRRNEICQSELRQEMEARLTLESPSPSPSSGAAEPGEDSECRAVRFEPSPLKRPQLRSRRTCCWRRGSWPWRLSSRLWRRRELAELAELPDEAPEEDQDDQGDMAAMVMVGWDPETGRPVISEEVQPDPSSSAFSARVKDAVPWPS